MGSISHMRLVGTTCQVAPTEKSSFVKQKGQHTTKKRDRTLWGVARFSLLLAGLVSRLKCG
jgi:hypothetical protein